MLHVSRFIIFSEKGSRYDFYSTAESLRKISKLTSTKTHTCKCPFISIFQFNPYVFIFLLIQITFKFTPSFLLWKMYSS